MMLTCCRGLFTPVPDAAFDRVNGTTPRSFVNDSSGSDGLKEMFADSPRSSRRPIVWSMNCPQVKPHWVTPRSENTFWFTSLKIRLLMYRVFGPGDGVLFP